MNLKIYKKDDGFPVLFHRTYRDKAEKILEGGFKDGTGDYMTGEQHSGVWLSNYPLDCNEGAWGDTVLAVAFRVPLSNLDCFECLEEDKTYREWLVPASYIAQFATVESSTGECEDIFS